MAQAQLTDANATYANCGFGQPFSFEITCSGPSCDGLKDIPHLNCSTIDPATLHCTNGITCQDPSNFTSSFSLHESDATLTGAHNLTINGTQVQLQSTGLENASRVLIATSGSRRSSIPKLPRVALFLLIIMNLFTTHVHAQAPHIYARGPIDIIGIVGQIDSLLPALV
jgi:hypothetical protein